MGIDDSADRPFLSGKATLLIPRSSTHCISSALDPDADQTPPLDCSNMGLVNRPSRGQPASFTNEMTLDSTDEKALIMQ